MSESFTGESLLAALRRRRAKRVLVMGDPLGRHLAELASGGVDVVSATVDPFTLDLHGAFLSPGRPPLSEALEAELAAAEPAPDDAGAAAAILARLAPGSPARGLALAALVMAMSARASRPGEGWDSLVGRFAKWAAQRFVAQNGHHEVWARPTAEMLLCGTYHALLLFLAPTPAEEEWRAQAGRLGYEPPPPQADLLAALGESWQVAGAHLPAAFALTAPGLERSLRGEFAGFAGLRQNPCDLFGRPSSFWSS